MIAFYSIPAAIWFGVAIPVWTGRWPRNEDARLWIGIALGWVALAFLALMGGDATLFIVLGMVGLASAATVLYRVFKKPTSDQMLVFFDLAFISVFLAALLVAKS